MDRHLDRRQLLRIAGRGGAAAAAVAVVGRRGLTARTVAQEPPNFDGVELTATLIGGGAYDRLYTKLDEWQELTGARIDTSTRLAHSELNEKLRREYASGSPSFNWSSDHTIYWPEWQIALEPLRQYADEADLADFTPSVLEACTGLADGELYMIPRHVDIQLMYYRKDLFEDPKEQSDFRAKYGYDLQPPTNWQEWLDVAEFFTRPPDLFGFVAAGGGSFESLLASAGGQLLDEQNRPAWNSEQGRQALAHMVELYKVRETVPEGALQYGWDDVTQLFRTGKIAFYFEWPGWYQQLKDPSQSDVVGKFDIAKVPAGPAGPENMRTTAGSHGFTIARQSDNKDASYSAISWITSPDAEFFEFIEGGFLPVRNSVWERVRSHVEESGDELDKKRLELLQDSIANNFWTFPTRQVPQFMSVRAETLLPAIERALLGEIEVEQALEESSKAAEDLLRELGAIE